MRCIEVGDHEDLRIDGEPIEKVDSNKYLGVQIDSRLTFKKERLDTAIKKMAIKSNFLGRISRKLTSTTKVMIFKSITTTHRLLLVLNFYGQ
jgi:hypothetical protein